MPTAIRSILRDSAARSSTAASSRAASMSAEAWVQHAASSFIKQSPVKAAMAGPRPKGRPKSASPKPRTPIVVTLRGSSKWEAWMDKLCDALSRQTGVPKIDRTIAIDMALGKLAAQNTGVGTPPPRY